MKMIVNLVQVLLVMGVAYPVYAMWSNDQISNFCAEIKPNMTKQYLLNLSKQKNITLDLNDDGAIKWLAMAKVPASFSNEVCQIRGLGNRVASAKMAMK